MDHTFRITKKIGYTDEISGRFVPQGVAIDSNYLTMDHTFRTTKKIGYTDEISGRFVPQRELQVTAII